MEPPPLLVPITDQNMLQGNNFDTLLEPGIRGRSKYTSSSFAFSLSVFWSCDCFKGWWIGASLEQYLKIKLGVWASLVLVAIIAVEALLLVALLTAKEPAPLLGYLTKVGEDYLIVWNLADGRQEPLAKRFASLSAASKFAKDELNLGTGVPAAGALPMEMLWIESGPDKHALHWKMVGSPYVFRMTFLARQDAEVFASAFRLGAYRPSSVGHAIVLLPSSPNAVN